MNARPQLLIVDDNPDFVDNLEEILESTGYAVRSAPSFARALELAAAGFDVALVDVRLPDGDGNALAPRLKQLSPDGEVVLLTGFATLETAVGAVRAGASAYLVKPCATPDLLLTVEQAMRKVRLQSEKRELQRRAHVAEKLAAVGTLTAGLSHEIRNPLNSAALQLAVLERRLGKLDASLQPPLLEPLGLVREEIRRLERILQDFLQFARPGELVLKAFDLEALVGTVVHLMAEEAASRGITLETRSHAMRPALGDAERLKQVLLNLVLNAFQATPRGGTVRLITRPGPGEAQVEVEDSGAGIAEAARARLFEPFFTTRPGGTGLGLALVHAIVTQHGGRIRVLSSLLGGARFQLTLPFSVEWG